VAWTTFPSAGEPLRASVLQALIEELRPNGARKTAAEIVSNSNTPQDDDELTVPVAASTFYKVNGELLFTSNTTADFRWTWSMPAGATRSIDVFIFSRSLAAPSQMVDTRTFATGNSGADGLGLTLSSQGQIVKFSGWILTSTTAGNVTLQWSQNTTNLSDTTVHPNSFLELKRITAS
jgi:hypothetical protein